MKRTHHIAKKIHLWIGLVSGLITSISGLSGALYLWQPELSAALNPSILKVANQQFFSEPTIHRTAYSLYETYRDSIDHLTLPFREQQTIQIAFKNGTSLFFHPQTKELLGEKTFSIRFFEGLLNFHRTLLIPHYGKYLMGGSTVLFFTLLLSSGLYLWWKRYHSNWKKGVSLSLRKSKIFNYDWHKALGIVFFIPLLTIAITGAYFTFLPAYKSVFKLMDVPITKTQALTALQTPTEMFPEDLLRAPQMDGYKLRAVYFPKDSLSNYRFRYIHDREISAGLRKTKEIGIDPHHQVTLLSEYHQSTRSEKISAQMYPVHIGEIFGTLGRILVFISGLIPVILLITGYRIYRDWNFNKPEKGGLQKSNQPLDTA